MIIKVRDPFSGLSHLMGAVLAIVALILLVYNAAYYAKIRHVISFAIFGASLILLYTASALYHLLPLSQKGVRLLRRIDHMMIFVLIAGTYTPICLIPLRGAWGYSLLIGVWLVAIIGILFKIFKLETQRWLSTSIYLVMGWLIAIALWPLAKTISVEGVAWMMLGGIFYTVGALLYGAKWPPNIIPGWLGFHEIFHLFIITGSFCHFWLMMKYIMYV